MLIGFTLLLCSPAYAENRWCYQEFANESSACGGIDGGSYSYTGTFKEAPRDAEAAFDGDWLTSAECENGFDCYIFINYTRLDKNSLSDKIELELYGTGRLNSSIPISCLSTEDLRLRAFFNGSSDLKVINLTCHDGSNWVEVYSANSMKFNEEGMYWYFANTSLDKPSSTTTFNSTTIPTFNWTNDAWLSGFVDYRMEVKDSTSKVTYNKSFDTYHVSSYWPLNGSAQDERGSVDGTLNGWTWNHGERQGGVTISGGEAQFDGLDGSIIVDSPSPFNTKGAIHIEHRAKSFQSSRIFITNEDFSPSIQLRITGGEYVVYANNGVLSDSYTYTTNNTGQLYKTTIVYNSSKILVYVDGNLKKTFNFSGDFTDTNQIIFGKYGTTSSDFYDGNISKVRVWDNVTITQSEIQSEINSDYPVKGEGLVLSYDFDHYNATHVFDTHHMVQGKDTNTSAIRFDGVDDYISAGNSITGYPFTMNVWGKVHKDEDAYFMSITDLGTSSIYDCIKYESGDDSFEVIKRNGVESSFILDTINTVELDRWYMITAVLHNETLMDLYVNGSYEDTRYSGYISFNSDIDATLIGNLRTGGPIYSNATIGEASVYPIALTASQIKVLYANQSQQHLCSDGSIGALNGSTCGGTCPKACTEEPSIPKANMTLNLNSDWRVCVYNDSIRQYCTDYMTFLYNSSPPSLSAWQTAPGTAYTISTLLFNGTCTDVDTGETITSYCQVYNGTSKVGAVTTVSPTLSQDTQFCSVANTSTLKTESWKAELWCSDGTDNSTKVNTSSISILNSVPSLDATATYPAAPYTIDNLLYNSTCDDWDNADSITAYCQFYNGTVKFGPITSTAISQATNEQICTLPSATTYKHESWKAEVWCGDGESNSTKTNTSALTILNSIPTPATSVTLTPLEPANASTLTCSWTQGSDADGDTIYDEVWWYKDGIEQPAFRNQSTIANSSTAGGEVWNCSVRQSDLESNSAFNETLPVTINNPASISAVNLILLDLLEGRQRYRINYSVTDIDGDPITCQITTQAGAKPVMYNSSLGICEGEFNMSQASSNTFTPKADDGNDTTRAPPKEGVEIVFSSYLADQTNTNTLQRQHYLQQYNITNNEPVNFTDISWSLNSTDTIKTLNLTNQTTFQDNRTPFSGDFITEDTTYTFSGDNFIAENTYAVTRYLVYNNTRSRRLPKLELSIPLKSYNDTFLAEKQEGLLWPDITSSNNKTYAKFNVSGVNASNHSWYRYGYNAVFIDWTGEASSDNRLSGQYKEWTLDRVYRVNFNLTGKTVLDYVLAGNLGEWLSKTGTWTSYLTRQSTSEAYTHTTTDNVNSVELSFDPPADNFTYQLLYYSLVQEGGGSSSGGGGGGAPSPLPETTNQSLPVRFGKVLYAKPLQNFLVTRLPAEFYTEMLIEANGTVAGVLEFSENLAPICKADVCDIGSEECQTKVIMDDGETKLLRLYCAADGELAGIILEDQVYEGLLKIRTPQTVSDLPIQLEKAPVYEWTHRISSALGIPEQMVATGLGILAVVVALSVIYFIATKAQGG